MQTKGVLRAIVIDDEQPARQRIRDLLAEHTDMLVLVAEADNGTEALRLIQHLQPDLIFLDILMPGITGLEVLAKLPSPPLVVFTTALEHYALKAFDLNAADYLLKPITAERLAQTLARVNQLVNATGDAQPNGVQAPDTRLETEGSYSTLRTLPVKIGDRVMLIRTEQVAYFQADSKYVNVILTDGRKYLLEKSITYLEGRLTEDFLRISRSVLVNMPHVVEVTKLLGSRYALKLNDKQNSVVESGVQYAGAIKMRLQF